MRFTQDPRSSAHVIRAYGGGELRIDDQVFRATVVLSASVIRQEPAIRAVSDLAGFDAARILDLDPDLVLLGTGLKQVFPAAAFRAQFLTAGVGLEVMDSGAACRTFNVLVAEQRRVAALLIMEGSKQ